MKSFSILDPRIKKGLSEFGFKRPTDIQEVAIPKIIEGGNVLVIAPTGIGKTEATILPVFHRFLQKKHKGISILYITPLRALNRDMMERMEKWGEKLALKISVRHGDTNQYQRRKQALSPPDMLITTPETIQAILPGKVMRRHLKNVHYVIVDEIHELAEDKRGVQLSLALERLTQVSKRKFQRIGISATVGSPEEVAMFLSPLDPIDIVRVSVARKMKLAVERPKPKKGDPEISGRTFSALDASTRLRRMMELIKEHSSTLIFVNTREMAEILASRFRIMGQEVGIHHSSLSQEVRISTEQDFKAGKYRALICTSSLELGIDIGSVELVIQYKSPRQVTRLLQRVGRSGHKVGRTSKGIILATDSDDILESLVIVRKAYNEELEELEIPQGSYDVLAHQLVGLSMEYKRVERKSALELVKMAYPYRELQEGEFNDVLKLLSELRLIWLEEEHFGRRRHTLKYYFGNLSTIPDEKNYFVTNIISRERVGVWDEPFVIKNAEPGNIVIFKGAPWRVLSVDEGEIYVEPVGSIQGAIPSWEGEQIPVTFEIAEEVGRLRGKTGSLDMEAFKAYSGDSYTLRLGRSKMLSQKRKGLEIPTPDNILIEMFSNFAIIHSPFGMKVNETLGRAFSILLTSNLGHSIGLITDAYRIILQSPYPIKKDALQEIFSLEFDFLEPLLYSALKRIPLFRWKFVNVAKRFGAISKDYQHTNIAMPRIIESYANSPIYKETFREILKNNLDLEKARIIMDEIRLGTRKVSFVHLKEPSPLGELGLKEYTEIILPKRAEAVILKALKRRIDDSKIELFCLYCADWYLKLSIKNLPEVIQCENCGAKMLGVLKGKSNRDRRRIYKKYKSSKKLTPEEEKEILRMKLSANLFLSYGKKAAVVQAARGIGPETAKRILGRSRWDDDLMGEILKAERDYARTRRFWE